MTENKIEQSDNTPSGEQALFSAQEVLLTLTVNQNIIIQRRGTSWQSNLTSVNNQLLEQMMATWQSSQGFIVDAPQGIDRQMALRIQAMLAGEQQARILDLYADDHQLLVYQHQQDIWLSLPLQLYNQLVPAELFN